MESHNNDWSDQLRNLVIAGCQVMALILTAEQMGYHCHDWFRDRIERYRKWLRNQEFEIYYAALWPKLRSAKDEPD